jgi:hypothetical protein
MGLPVSNQPSWGDSTAISAVKINGVLSAQAGDISPPAGSGLLTLKPSSGDSLEMSLRKINGLLANGYVPLNGTAQLGQVALAAKLDDPSVPGPQGSFIILADPAGSKASLAMGDLYIIWTNKGDTARTGIYVDASGDLYAYQINGPNAGKRVDFCKGAWR